MKFAPGGGYACPKCGRKVEAEKPQAPEPEAEQPPEVEKACGAAPEPKKKPGLRKALLDATLAAEVELEKHLQGQHDQTTHGHRAGRRSGSETGASAPTSPQPKKPSSFFRQGVNSKQREQWEAGQMKRAKGAQKPERPLGDAVRDLARQTAEHFSPAEMQAELKRLRGLLASETKPGMRDAIEGQIKYTQTALDMARSGKPEVSVQGQPKAEIPTELPEIFGGKHPKDMSLSEMARVIRRDWKNVYFGARPYLDALGSLGKISDSYGADSGASVVNYFLANAGTWKGPAAKLIKAELNRLLKGAYKGLDAKKA